MGYERNPKLSEQISNWELYRPFAEKYGLILTMYVEDFISIYVLSQLLREYALICHPDEQSESSSLNNLNLKTKFAKWICKTCIYYDKDYNYTVDFEEFNDSGFNPAFKWSDLEKTVKGSIASKMINKIKFVYQQTKAHVSESKMYYLLNSEHVHQAVICGGNSDVYKCPNYIGYKTEIQEQKIKDILRNAKKPKLGDILEYAHFYALDFKGEDLGYARHLKIYSKSDLSGLKSRLEESFTPFAKEFKRISLECENLDQFEIKMNILLKEYGC